jgi:Cu(I)/Ag(I) efflux system protein CusF
MPAVARPAQDIEVKVRKPEVRRIDRDAGKITLRHGEIKSLDMPGMTMVFMVKDAALLGAVKVGDKVKFRAEKSGGGYMVTAMEAAK